MTQQDVKVRYWAIGQLILARVREFCANRLQFFGCTGFRS